MAIFDQVTNFAYTTVLTPPSPATSGLTIVLASGGGSLFPSFPGEDYNCTVWIAGAGPLTGNAEIVRVSGRSGDTLTLAARAQEGTSARTILAGDQFALTITRKTIVDLQDAINSAPGTGDVVGPASAVDGHVAVYDGTTGKIIKDGGALGSAAFVATSAFDTAGAAAAAQAASDPLGAAAAAAAASVPTSRTVNGHALSADVTVSKSDVSLGSVTNDAQTKAAIVPNTAPSAGQLLVGNAGGTAYAPVSASGDATIASTGVVAVAKVNGVSITGTPTAGQVPIASTGSAAAWGTPSGGGDLLASANLSDLASPKVGFDNINVHGADVASAGTIDLDAATGVLVDVTGTTTITAVTLANGRERVVRFTGALTFTHGSSLVLPGGANITTAAGDFALLRGYASSVVRCVAYSKATGKSTVLPSATDVGLGNVTNDAQTKAAIVPNTAPAAGQLAVGNAGGTAYAPVTVSGDATLASTGAVAIGSVQSGATGSTPTAGDASTKLATTQFVQTAVLQGPAKEAVKYASIAALPSIVYANGSSGVGATLTGVALAAIALDSASPAVNDRVLIKNQASTFQNGIYTVTATGSGIAVFVLTRATDFDQASDIKTGASTFVTAGTTLASTTWDVNSADSPVMGTDAITFTQTAGPGSITAGNGITVTGSSVAIDTSVTVDKTTAQTLTNKTLTTPVVNGLPTGTGISASATASTVASRDGSANATSNNFIAGYTTTPTAAGTTTLTVASTRQQFFTGSTTQTVTLPVTSTLALGFIFEIENNSTGVVTVNSSGSNAVRLMAPGSRALFTCILTSGTSASSWDVFSGILPYPIAMSDVSTAITAGTDKTVPMRMPWAGTLIAVRAACKTAPTGSSIIINVKKNGTTVLSTNLSIDISATTSVGSAAPVVISVPDFAADDLFTYDFTQVGSTIAGGGVVVTPYLKY